MLFGNREFLNSIYGIYGSKSGWSNLDRLRDADCLIFFLVGPSPDGNCELQ